MTKGFVSMTKIFVNANGGETTGYFARIARPRARQARLWTVKT